MTFTKVRTFLIHRVIVGINGGEEDRLTLKGVPVGKRRLLSPQLRHRIEQVLIQLPPALQHLVGYYVRVHRSGHGLVIAHSLVQRLAKLQSEASIRVIMMGLYHPQVWHNRSFAGEQRRITQHVLQWSQVSGLGIVDTYQRFALEPAPERFYAHSHLNARGNALVASLLASVLSNRHSSARSGPDASGEVVDTTKEPGSM